MKRIFLSALILLSSLNVKANCETPVTYLLEGEKTPCAGYLFRPDKELEVRVIVATFDNLKRQNDTQLEMITVLNQRLNINTEQQNILAQQLGKAEENQRITNTIWFAVGTLLGGLVVNELRKDR